MSNNLLLGNGLNIHFGITDLYQDTILLRFKDVLLKSTSLYKTLFNISFSEDILNEIIFSSPNKGIETIAHAIYIYASQNMQDQISINSKIRLLDAIKTSAINAIFYKNNHQIELSNNNSATLERIHNYKNIFTLNYVEAWDQSNRCIYLHGHYNIPAIRHTSKNILLYDKYRYGTVTGYDSAVQSLENNYQMIPFAGNDIVFSPLLDKQEVLNLGKFPDEALFPAEDLFPSEPHSLYVELDNIKSLDIFGMSPYGDDKLLQKISLIPELTIYVYNMAHSSETVEWNRILNRECCIDSSHFSD